jgi:Protein of unknown function (DUF3304)
MRSGLSLSGNSSMLDTLKRPSVQPSLRAAGVMLLREFRVVSALLLKRVALIARTWLTVGLAGLLLACSKPAAEKITANLSPYNHTPDYIHQYYIDGQWGGNSWAYGGGGKFVCCIIYPRQWRPDLTAKVRWTTSSSDPKATGDAAKEKWHEATVAIERYTEPGTRLNVHFLPKGEVRLLISNKSAGHPDYPGPPAPEKPADFPFQRD